MVNTKYVWAIVLSIIQIEILLKGDLQMIEQSYLHIN